VISHYDGRVDNAVAFFRDSKSAHDCRADLRKIGVTCGSPQKQFATGEFAFEMNIETIEVFTPEPSAPVEYPKTAMGEAFAQAGLLK